MEEIVVAVASEHQIAIILVQVGRNMIENVLLDRRLAINTIAIIRPSMSPNSCSHMGLGLRCL